jgi:hypothetical protein
MRQKLLLFLSLWCAVATVVFAAPGCYGENCNGGFESFADDPGEGHMVSDTMWESNANGEKWLHFPRQRWYSFNIPALAGRTPFQVVPYLSANEFQNQPQANQVIGAGNIATIFNVRPNGVDVINDTCSDYYLRLTIVVAPAPPAPPPPPVESDAGTP